MRCGEAFERREGFFADVVLDALGIGLCDGFADAEREEEGDDDLVPVTDALGEFLAIPGIDACKAAIETDKDANVRAAAASALGPSLAVTTWWPARRRMRSTRSRL